jgi:dolichol kinase
LQKSNKVTPDWRTTLAKELKRKLIHITGLSVPVGIIVFGKVVTAALIAVALAGSFVLEAGRLRGKITLPSVREHELDKTAGYVYYILGSLITVVFFKPAVAIAAMLMLSVGDAASGIIGSVLRGSNVRTEESAKRIKPLPITLGMFLVCLALGYLSSGVTGLPFVVYLAGAVGATLADGVPVYIGKRCLDDNLTIPIYAGLFMSLAGAARLL